MLQVRKVIEHVYEKVMGQGSDAGSQAATSSTTNGQERSEAEKEEDLPSIAEEKVELLCNDQVCCIYIDIKTYVLVSHGIKRLYINDMFGLHQLSLFGYTF